MCGRFVLDDPGSTLTTILYSLNRPFIRVQQFPTRFFSDLQRMNAGMTPQYRSAGGSVDNSISVGDVNIQAASQNMTPREVAKAIGREVRRKTVR